MFDQGGDIDWLEKIATLYDNVKGLILYCEEIYPEKKTNPQILLDLRDTLDHLIRAISAELEQIIIEDKQKYKETNLDKAFGHLYRAGYDALDWAGLILRISIDNELKSLSPKTKNTILPEYYKTMKPRILEINNEIALIRNRKDIGTKNLEDFNKYLGMVQELKDYLNEIIKIKPSLIEYESGLRWDWLKEGAKTLAITLIGGILVGLFLAKIV